MNGAGTTVDCKGWLQSQGSGHEEAHSAGSGKCLLQPGLVPSIAYLSPHLLFSRTQDPFLTRQEAEPRDYPASQSQDFLHDFGVGYSQASWVNWRPQGHQTGQGPGASRQPQAGGLGFWRRCTGGPVISCLLIQVATLLRTITDLQ